MQRARSGARHRDGERPAAGCARGKWGERPIARGPLMVVMMPSLCRSPYSLFAGGSPRAWGERVLALTWGGGRQALQRGATCHPGTSPSCFPCCSSPLWRPSFGTFTPALLSRITDNRPPLALPQDSRPPYSSDLVTPEPPSKFCGMLRVGSLCFLTFSPVWLRQWGGAGKGAPGGGSPHPRAACLHLGYVGWGW